MVSKTAVIALVAIIAVPIMLGYAMNLEQVTETDYKVSGDSVNVTPLLQNGTTYTTAFGDIYQLNTNFEKFGGETYPFYERQSTTKTSFPFFNAAEPNFVSGRQYLTNLDKYFISFDYPTYSSSSYVRLQILNTNYEYIRTIDHIVYTYYDRATDLIGIVEKTPGGGNSYAISGGNYGALEFTLIGMSSISQTYGYLYSAGNANYYADISAGYHFIKDWWDSYDILFPDNTYNAMVSINLDSITDANYSFQIRAGSVDDTYTLTKTTTGSDVSWTVSSARSGTHDLYYDQNINDNTDQVFFQYADTDTGDNVYDRHVEFRYVGHWPTVIGPANYYQNYVLDYQVTSSLPNNINSLYVKLFSNRSPTMRIDSAEFSAMEYPIIENITYTPSDFKTNPSTTITNPQIYGPSFSFGGNTYTVKQGNITIGNHDIPIKDLVLSSKPNPNGGYDNKIGNTIVSTTAQPSTITFNGKWSASISTTAQEEYEYTKTEWIVGSFAWDGVDQNFLMVGLITCLGVFIALGIYARRSGARVLPLMVVCGGAALLFFVML